MSYLILPEEYAKAVNAIHPATNLAVGTNFKITAPLSIIPTPITRMPPIPARKGFIN